MHKKSISYIDGAKHSNPHTRYGAIENTNAMKVVQNCLKQSFQLQIVKNCRQFAMKNLFLSIINCRLSDMNVLQEYFPAEFFPDFGISNTYT